MNLAIKIISKKLMTKISHISRGGYDKGFYGIRNLISQNKWIFNTFVTNMLIINSTLKDIWFTFGMQYLNFILINSSISIKLL